jgi:hypothetical protein
MIGGPIPAPSPPGRKVVQLGEQVLPPGQQRRRQGRRSARPAPAVPAARFAGETSSLQALGPPAAAADEATCPSSSQIQPGPPGRGPARPLTYLGDSA